MPDTDFADFLTDIVKFKQSHRHLLELIEEAVIAHNFMRIVEVRREQRNMRKRKRMLPDRQREKTEEGKSKIGKILFEIKRNEVVFPSNVHSDEEENRKQGRGHCQRKTGKKMSNLFFNVTHLTRFSDPVKLGIFTPELPNSQKNLWQNIIPFLIPFLFIKQLIIIIILIVRFLFFFSFHPPVMINI